MPVTGAAALATAAAHRGLDLGCNYVGEAVTSGSTGGGAGDGVELRAMFSWSVGAGRKVGDRFEVTSDELLGKGADFTYAPPCT